MTGGSIMDEKIIAHILDGHPDDFGILVDKYYNELFVFIHNQTNDIEMTKDILQEICMRLYQNLSKYDSRKATYRTWMYRVASNYVFSYLKKQKYYIKDYDFNFVSANEDIIQQCIQEDDVKQIISVMKKVLNAKHYQMMILHFFSDLSVLEIAETLHVSEKTVRNTISLSIKKTRNQMGGNSDDV